jgi:uncharacterized membrane protein
MTPAIERRIQKLFIAVAGLLYVLLSAFTGILPPDDKRTFEEKFTPWHPWLALFCLLAALVAVYILGIITGYEEEERAKVAERTLRT